MDDVAPIPLPTADEIRLAAALGRDREVVALIDADPLSAWFGILPDEFRAILDRLSPELTASSALVRGFRLILGGVAGPPARDGGDRATIAMLSARAVGLRLQGSPVQAINAFDGARGTDPSINSLFDVTTGWHSFVAVQSGITRMLAGDIAAALAQFAAATATRVPEALTFLLRDGYVKSALAHALYGEPWTARRQLELAARLPRTASWAEEIVSAHAEIASALVDEPDADAAIDRLERVPATLVGEMWPFWLEAVHRSYLRAGRVHTAERRVRELSAATPASSSLEGYPASILPLVRALTALSSGDPAALRRALAETDSDQIPLRLLGAYQDIQDMRLDVAVAELVGLRSRTAPLAFWDALRTILLAWALLRHDEPDDAARLLRGLLSEWRDADPEWRMMVPPELNAFAVSSFDAWPGRTIADMSAPVAPATPLTQRERQVLTLMASDRSRDQIAQELFVSANTVKSQLRSIYRKLGVSSRTAALLEADRRGLI